MDNRTIYHGASANIDAWNRTLCQVLDEMRACYETRNFAPLLGLIEEAQIYGNRMESKLRDVKDYAFIKEKYNDVKARMAKLEQRCEKDKIKP